MVPGPPHCGGRTLPTPQTPLHRRVVIRSRLWSLHRSNPKNWIDGDTGSVLLKSVPDIAVEVVVASEQKSAALGESYRRDSADDVIVRVHSNLLVGTDVEQSAGGVIRASRERKPARKELNHHSTVIRTLLQRQLEFRQNH